MNHNIDLATNASKLWEADLRALYASLACFLPTDLVVTSERSQDLHRPKTESFNIELSELNFAEEHLLKTLLRPPPNRVLQNETPR